MSPEKRRSCLSVCRPSIRPEALGSVSQITGAWVKSTVGGGYYAAYFSYILQTPIRIGSESELP